MTKFRARKHLNQSELAGKHLNQSQLAGKRLNQSQLSNDDVMSRAEIGRACRAFSISPSQLKSGTGRASNAA